MTGIVNSTGARSGIIGTTVGTPPATNAADIGSGILPVGVTGGSGLDAVSAGKVLQVVDATLSNIDTDANATSTESVYANCTGEIDITDGNKVLIYAHASFLIDGGSNAVMLAHIREGTSTAGTIIATNLFGNSSTDSLLYTPQFFTCFDDSPDGTTPDYAMTLVRDSSGTDSVRLFSDTAAYLKMILIEIEA